MSYIKNIAIRSFFISGIIFFLLCGVYFSIPVILEKKILPLLFNKAGFVQSTGKIRKFGFTGLDVTSVRLGNPENPSISLDSIRIDYSLMGLARRHIKKIIISGVEIRAEFKDGKMGIPGIDFGKLFRNSSNTGREQQTVSQRIPINIGELEIRHAAVLLKSGVEDFYIPFSMRIYPVFENKEEQPSGYAIQYRLDPQHANIFHGVRIKSRINGSAMYNFTTSDLALRLDLTDMDVVYNDLQFKNTSKDVPLIITITRTKNIVQMHFNRFSVMSLLPFEVSMNPDSHLTVNMDEDTLNAEGSVKVFLKKELMNNDPHIGLKLGQSAELPIFLKGETQGKQWRFSLNSAGTSHPLTFSRGTETMTLFPKELSIQGEGLNTSGSLQFDANLIHVRYKGDNMHILIPLVSLQGSGLLNSTESSSLRAFVQITDAECASHDFNARKIQAKIPIQWPFPASEDNDSIAEDTNYPYVAIDDINYGGINIGSIVATPYQNGANLHFTGLFKGLLFPGFNVNFKGMAGLNDENTFISKVDFNSAEPEKTLQFELSSVASQFSGIFFNGIADIRGNWSFDGTRGTSTGMVLLRNTKIDSPQKKMTIEGVELQLAMSDLLNLRSDPGQVLKFQRFTWGDIEISEGEASFQIESPSSLFLKKSSFLWCGGNVYTHGLRLKPGNDGLDIICYCDRLRLATVLKQFHLASAEGEGSVNGRLPISYKNGEIKIADGFLYSTPGEGGIIRFNTETLIPGAAGTQKGIQTDVAMEALKDFHYDWAKLSLLSKGEDLHVYLQMEGAPVNLLPFAYTKKSGLVKAKGEPKARFQKILFHFNFTLPIDELLHYGAGLGELLQYQ